jgi:hypothetical protein
VDILKLRQLSISQHVRYLGTGKTNKSTQNKKKAKKVDAEALTTDSDGMGSPEEHNQQAREIAVDSLPRKK